MTHYGNYAKDRLALQLFRSLFSFVKKWTQFELLTNKPLNLSELFFSYFPEDKEPLWTVSILQCYECQLKYVLYMYMGKFSSP